MKLIYSRWLQQTVKKEDTNFITATSTYIDTLTERQAVINANTTDLEILAAHVETLRLPEKKLEYPLLETLPLTGIKAYFGSGKALINALPKDPAIVDLVLETVTAIIQSETYLYQERQLCTSRSEYDKYWESVYGESCHYYCNLERVQTRFMERIQPIYRDKHLFCRQRLISIYQLTEQTYRFNINLTDSFHEIAIILETAGKGHVITSISGNLLRCPDQVCRETELKLDLLKEKPLIGIPIKDIIKYTGSNDGCTHLGQMLVEGAKSIPLLELIQS